MKSLQTRPTRCVAVVRCKAADWLEARGDWRAAGVRWMAENGKRPSNYALSSSVWDWWTHNASFVSCVPPDLFGALYGEILAGAIHKEYPTREAAELALCRAIASQEAVA